jgi:pimeloyl-ACP methyl ester carboxylesterase
MWRTGRLASTHRHRGLILSDWLPRSLRRAAQVRQLAQTPVGLWHPQGDVEASLGYDAHLRSGWPQRLRRLVIAGSGPGGPDGPPPHPRVAEIAAKQVLTREDLHFLFFTDSEAGVEAAERHFTHIRVGEHAPVAVESGRRQREAIVAWWKGEGAARAHLTELSLPVLVANGVRDVMVPAEHSFAIARTAPNAKLVLYPDAGRAFLFQYAEEFTDEVLAFLR